MFQRTKAQTPLSVISPKSWELHRPCFNVKGVLVEGPNFNVYKIYTKKLLQM